MQGAEPYYFEGNNGKAVLLLHGYTGTPSQLFLLSQLLNEAGYAVYAPLLAGHGTCVEDLQATIAEDWYKSALEAYNKLAEYYSEIAVVGVSMGGLLAIRMAAEKKIWKIVCVATPMSLFDWRLRWLPVLKHVMSYARKRKHKYPVEARYNVSYGGKIPVLPLESMMILMRRCRHNFLGRIRVPILALHGGLDRTAKPESVEIITSHVRSKIKQSMTLQDSGHMVLLDKQRTFAEQQILEFLNR